MGLIEGFNCVTVVVDVSPFSCTDSSGVRSCGAAVVTVSVTAERWVNAGSFYVELTDNSVWATCTPSPDSEYAAWDGLSAPVSRTVTMSCSAYSYTIYLDGKQGGLFRLEIDGEFNPNPTGLGYPNPAYHWTGYF